MASEVDVQPTQHRSLTRPHPTPGRFASVSRLRVASSRISPTPSHSSLRPGAQEGSASPARAVIAQGGRPGEAGQQGGEDRTPHLGPQKRRPANPGLSSSTGAGERPSAGCAAIPAAGIQPASPALQRAGRGQPRSILAAGRQDDAPGTAQRLAVPGPSAAVFAQLPRQSAPT